MKRSREHKILSELPDACSSRSKGERRIEYRFRPILAAVMFVGALAAAKPACSEPYRLDVQDKVRIRVIEWRAGKGEYYEWSALGSEYLVGAGGSISMPLIGEIPVADKTTEQVATAVSNAVRTRAGLVNAPDVSVEVVQFRPIYVVGAVDRPGEYAYRPDLTVLKTIGIAGGLYRLTEGGLLRLERDRISAIGTSEATKFEIRRMLARRARLEAELAEADQMKMPPEIATEEDSAILIAEETFILQARNTAHRSQLKALVELKQLYAKEAKSLESKKATQDKQVALAQKELEGIGSLVRKGLAVAPREFALERVVADLESRTLDIETARLRAIQEMGKAERDATDLINDRHARIAIDLRETRASLEQLAAKLKTANDLVREAAVTAPRMVLDRSAALAERPTFWIVRKLDGAVSELPADENTIVRPGDVVRIEGASTGGVESTLGTPPKSSQSLTANGR